MKFRLLLLVLASLLVLRVPGNAQNSAEQEIRKAMDDNFVAIINKDAAALNRQYTDDYYRIGENGKVQGKGQTITGFLDPEWVITKLEPSEVKIRVQGNVAIVTELVTGSSGAKGQPQTEHVSRQTVVWVKEDGTWKKSVLQITSTTPIPTSAYGH